jgi:NAD(P)-dependent dehydrogenase (short-subunit alcohol dehydrogenase family)
MLKKGFGRIVNVASMAGTKGVGGGSAYSASKHGVLGLTKSAAIEYGAHNIRVNAVCPGFIETDMIKAVPKKILDFNTLVNPMKRLGNTKEVADTIVWLLCDESSFVNGSSMSIDGGYGNV